MARVLGPLLLLIGVVSLSDRLYYVATLALLVGLLLSLAWRPAPRVAPAPAEEMGRADLGSIPPAAPPTPSPPRLSPGARRQRRSRGTPIEHRP